MIEIDSIIKDFLNSQDLSEISDIYQKAYRFSVSRALKHAENEINDWKRSIEPYEEEIVKAARKYTENLNPATQGEYSEIPNPHQELPKFYRDYEYEYYDPTDEDMALYFWVKHPELKKFPGAHVKLWPEGDVEDIEFRFFTEDELRDWFDEITIEEYRELFNNNLSVDKYIERHPLESE